MAVPEAPQAGSFPILGGGIAFPNFLKSQIFFKVFFLIFKEKTFI